MSTFSPESLLSRLPDSGGVTPQVDAGITVFQFRDVLFAVWPSGIGLYCDGCKLYTSIREGDTVDTVWHRLVDQEMGYRRGGRSPVRAIDVQLVAEPVADEVDDILAWFAS